MSLVRVCLLVTFSVTVVLLAIGVESRKIHPWQVGWCVPRATYHCSDVWLPIRMTKQKWLAQNGMRTKVFRKVIRYVKEYKSSQIKALGRQVTQEMLDKMDVKVGGSVPTLKQIKQLLAEQTSDQGSRRKKRDILPFSKVPTMKWRMPIKYRFDGMHDEEDKKMIRAAIAHWEKDTCIRFKEIQERTSKQHLMITADEGGCFTFVGKVPTANAFPQQMNLQSNKCTKTLGIAAHELGHTLGMWHEHASPKSAGRVKVDWDNIGSMYLDQFVMKKPSVSDDKNIPYDSGSLLHYNSKQFAIDDSRYTLETADPLYQKTIGQSVGLSFFDRKLVNLAYCAVEMDACPKRDCKNRGYQDPNNCDRCLCPEGYGGANCELPAPQISACQPSNPVIELNSADEVCIQSDNYGRGPYKNGGLCNWHGSAPFGCKINMRFSDDFGVYCQKDKPTCEHWVELKYRGDLALTGPRFCCYDKPLFNGQSFLTSISNNVIVVFNSLYPLATNAFSYIPKPSERTGFKLCLSVNNTECLPTPLPPGCEPFGPWSECSRTCGGCGRKRSTRVCIDPKTGFKRIHSRFMPCEFDKCRQGDLQLYRFKQIGKKAKVVSRKRLSKCCLDYRNFPIKVLKNALSCKRVNGIRFDASEQPIGANDLNFDPSFWG